MALRIYISPHLDDAVFSCGGLIARQSSAGDEVRVVTVCAGDPPVGELTPFAYELHRRWGGSGSPMGLRRAEDHVACGRLGASVVHLPIPDAIYRRSSDGTALYPDNESLFGETAADDERTVEEIAAALRRTLVAEVEIYAPLGIGDHVDHRLTRRALTSLARPVWMYRDLPYALRTEDSPANVRDGVEAAVGLASEEIEVWAAACGEYRSQLAAFWSDFEAMEADLRMFHDQFGGIPLVHVETA